MRQFLALLSAALGIAGTVGCAPQLLFPDDAFGDPLGAVLSATDDPAAGSGSGSDGGQSGEADPPSSATGTSHVFSGNITGSGNYRLFELGSGSPGDEWLVSAAGPMSGPFVVVLFDADENLLMRTFMSYTNPLRHTVREASGMVYLGIMPPSSGDGGNFRLRASLETGQPVPAPARQLVWLNFAGGTSVQVHHRDPISFDPFDGAMIGEAYTDHTQELKDVIVREMQADYAAYNVVIMSSDDGSPPDGPYSIVHFGGSESGLLGLADNVDNYNQEPEQDAIVYVENFAPYWTMQLEPDEMAVMIANVASHELGHLLGLYHTQDPDDIMDTTGSAWDLAEEQSFIRAPLEASVFATGWEDSPRLLAQIVGSKPGGAAKAAARQRSAKWATYKAIRRFAQEEIRHTCGTCLNFDRE
jgi:hypothetical protein